jgi:hypothetical protein
MASGNSSGFRSMESADSPYAEELKQLLSLNTFADGSFNSSQYLMQQFIYNEIRDHEDLQADSVLNEFFVSKQNTAFDFLRTVNDQMQDGDLSQALITNNGVFTENIIEQNQATFNSIYITHYNSLTYSEEDVNALYNIANQCALEGGNAVYQSRNLLMLIENNIIEFNNGCETADETNNNRIVLSDQNSETNEHQIKLFPNPTRGNVMLECNLNTDETGTLIIFDNNGNQIKSYQLKSGAKSLSINLESLKQGSYLYEITINGKKIKKDKLVIVK